MKQRLLDLLREAAIHIIGRCMVWEIERASRVRERARRMERLWRRLMRGRSAQQMARMEQERQRRIAQGG